LSDDLIVNTVRSYSSGLVGRSLNSARDHHFVIDGTNLAEELTSVEAFLSGVSSCGVNLVEVAARETGVPMTRTEVTIDGVRQPANPARFERIDLRFVLTGPTLEQAQVLVDQYQKR
jgi:uncharacterized OsmC-like protein